MLQRQPRRDETDGHLLLREVFEASGPIVEALLSTATFTAARVERLEVVAGGPVPVLVRVVVVDDRGGEHTFVGRPYGHAGGRLVRAVGDLVTSGFNRLPLPLRRKLAALLDEGEISVTLDPLFRSASAALVVPGNDPVSVFTLHEGDVH